ncbi:TPA: hypothetical protein HA241_07705, partial [Candidatus Woesearchaeota archaeon]|nr:hypothetical protein [Candidatus Woesearchaeota archaeon]
MTKQILEEVLQELGIESHQVTSGNQDLLHISYRDLRSLSYDPAQSSSEEIRVQQYTKIDFSKNGVVKVRKHFVRQEKDVVAWERILQYDDQERVSLIDSLSFSYSAATPQQVESQISGQCEKRFDEQGRVVRVNDPGAFEMENKFQPDGTVVTTTHWHLLNKPKTTHEPRGYTGPTSPLTSDQLWRQFYRD